MGRVLLGGAHPKELEVKEAAGECGRGDWLAGVGQHPGDTQMSMGIAVGKWPLPLMVSG